MGKSLPRTGAGDPEDESMQRMIITGALLLALGGCGRGAPPAAGNMAANPAQARLASPDGRSEVRRDADFSGLPAGIPAYPRVIGSGALQMGGVSDGNEMRVMAFQTADTAIQVIDFYAAAGARAGFREIHRATTGPRAVLGLERGNGDVMNVTATQTPHETRVQIMAGREGRRR
jgi:hypothetical protein